ncbi:spermatogenesis-associated protein 6 isoform X1 [Schistocerca serialis cubense]|uniref:spermatogenesis-associated protein 6 isoform X1 n=1 Tax=Schistocerca serialis cubense TaxID=2023355 RepID=UPI00214E72D9|nr:spermatogenesis-associated protein 6 isoform X1 [Schistocerca serialis cubense]
MRRKVTNFVLEIEVHAATCPGVWLCPDGEVSVKLKLFGDFAETMHVEPVFPMLFHEKFTFQKIFPDISFLTDLQEALEKEKLYVDLIQWSITGSESVLATFETTLMDLLYPSSCRRKTTEADLLMDPTDAFPGILSPKLETSTKTTIEEIILTESELLDVSTPSAVNASKYELERYVVPSIRDAIKRQRKVCHTRLIHEKKGANCSYTLSQSQHEKSRRHSPFSIRNLDTTVNTYDSFLNTPSKRGRKKDFLKETPLGQWTSVSSWSDEAPIRHSSAINKSRKNRKTGTGSSSSGGKSPLRRNTTFTNQKSARIEIDPERSVNVPEPHDTSSCLMCSQYNSVFEDDNGNDHLYAFMPDVFPDSDDIFQQDNCPFIRPESCNSGSFERRKTSNK